jgi:medium-chain acyl-[acyl-carrier-protein] hydrolase
MSELAAKRPPPNGWIVRPKPNASAQVRLVCIPYAGGGTGIYRSWSAKLPPEVELCLAQLPGREVRFGEPLVDRSGVILDALARELKPLADLPLAIFGHSMGALLAFELARRLEGEGVNVLQLFVSGRRAPHLPERERLHDLPEAKFIEELRRLNGTPEEVFASAELMRLVLPILRADLAVDETHILKEEPKLSCPVLALGGRRDAMVPEASIEAWRDYTRGAFKTAFCQGDHFFVQQEREFVLREVASALKAQLSISFL